MTTDENESENAGPRLIVPEQYRGAKSSGIIDHSRPNPFGGEGTKPGAHPDKPEPSGTVTKHASAKALIGDVAAMIQQAGEQIIRIQAQHLAERPTLGQVQHAINQIDNKLYETLERLDVIIDVKIKNIVDAVLEDRLKDLQLTTTDEYPARVAESALTDSPQTDMQIGESATIVEPAGYEPLSSGE